MAAETSWHRYGMKLRHCHPVQALTLDNKRRHKAYIVCSTCQLKNSNLHCCVLARKLISRLTACCAVWAYVARDTLLLVDGL